MTRQLNIPQRQRSLVLSSALPLLALLLVGGALTRPAAAQDFHLHDLSETEYEALERISENSVRGTVSFLASDELGGRGTPSKELNIASAYVASRLRAAGAEGLGPDGSFYLTSTIEATRAPSAGTRLQRGEGESIPHAVVASTSEGINYRGTIQRFDIASDESLSGPVVFVPSEEQLDARRFLPGLNAFANQVAERGGTALLVVASDESPFWEMAKTQQTKWQVPRRGAEFALPVVLVPRIDWNEESEELELVVPPMVVEDAEVHNVCGVIRGSDPELAKEAIIFSAHLDHLGRGAPGPDPIYNGADDDASGVTAVLTVADAYGALDEKPARSVIFLTFWGEERGLLGSREFVEDSPWPLEQVVANVNIEMIGRPAEGARNKMWMTGWRKSDLGSIFAIGSRRVGVESFEHPQFSEMLYTRSDNWAFAQQGVVAHSFSAGSLHADYHQPSDEWEKLDLPHMTQIIRGLFAGSLPLAKGKVTPEQK